jgi:hypothetical protein
VCGASLNYYEQANQLKDIRAKSDLGLAKFSCCQGALRRAEKTCTATAVGVGKPEVAGSGSGRTQPERNDAAGGMKFFQEKNLEISFTACKTGCIRSTSPVSRSKGIFRSCPLAH